MSAKRQAYDQAKAELTRLDAQMAGERAHIDVDNPQAVAQFRQQLARRDELSRQTSGPLASDLSSTVAHYNATVNEYNARCANRPRNADIVASVQATLSCPARY